MRISAGEVRAGTRFGPYELERQLAVGGMAEIYLAKATGISGFEKYVALKLILPNYAEDDHFIQMLVEEAKIAVHLTQPNIVQIFDLGRIGDVYFIAMEYVDGADLYHVMRSITSVGEMVDFDVAAHIALETCAALDYAHRCTDQVGLHLGIIHRDISPQNIIVSRAGEVKLADFGIAKASVRARQTAVGVIKGKYYYMSPEQAWGDPIDHRTDLFSTGVVLYEILAGQMLYLEEDLGKLLDRVRKAEIAPPSSLRPGVPPELEKIVMKAVARRPEDRFQSAYDLQVALTHFLFSYSPNYNVQRLQSLVGRAITLDEQRRYHEGDGTSSELGTEPVVTGAPVLRDSLMDVVEFHPLTSHSVLSGELMEESTRPAHGLPAYDAFDDEDATLISDPPDMGNHPLPAPVLPVIASVSGGSTGEWADQDETTTVLRGSQGLQPAPHAMPLPPIPPRHAGHRPPRPSEEMTRPLLPDDHPAAYPGVGQPSEAPVGPVARVSEQAPTTQWPVVSPPAPAQAQAQAQAQVYMPGQAVGQPAVPAGLPPQLQPAPDPPLPDPGADDVAVEQMLQRSRKQRHLILLGVLICVVLIGVAVFIITARSVTSEPGSVRVITEPAGAKVYYQGKYVGDTPHRLDSLPLDEVHWVRLESKRCESKAVRLKVEAGKVKTVRVKLDKCEKR